MKLKFLRESKKRKVKKSEPRDIGPEGNPPYGIPDHMMTTPEQQRGEELDNEDYKVLYHDLLDIIRDNRANSEKREQELMKRVKKTLESQKKSYQETVDRDYVERSKIYNKDFFFKYVKVFMTRHLNANKLTVKSSLNKATGQTDYNVDISYN